MRHSLVLALDLLHRVSRVALRRFSPHHNGERHDRTRLTAEDLFDKLVTKHLGRKLSPAGCP
jgi:hypothetical protein